MAVSMTQAKFDALCDKIEEAEYRCDDWFPTIEDIKNDLEPNIEKDLDFAIWILETSNPPATEGQKEAKAYLMNLVNKSLNIIDG